MAEVLGIVSGSLTLIQALSETLTGIQKISDFCSSVRDFPKNIRDAVTELQLLAQILQTLKKDRSFGEQTISTEALSYCGKVAAELEDVFLTIQREIHYAKKSKQCWTSVKTYVRKTKTDDIFRKLERAKTMLNLMISSHILIMQHAKNEDNIAQKAASDESVVPDNPKQEGIKCAPRVTKDYVAHNNYSLSCFLGLYNHHSGALRVSQVKDGQIIASEGHQIQKWTILPSAWLSKCGLAGMCVNKSLRREYQCTPIRVVPDSAPIINACRIGDIRAIRSLLIESQATVHDTTEWGWSLLHVAAMHAQVDLCRWLLQQGCNKQAVDVRNGWSPLHIISALSGRTSQSNLPHKKKELGILQAPEVPHSASKIQDMIRVLVEEGLYDPLDLSSTGWSALHEYSGPVGPFRYLLEQQNEFLINLQHFSREKHDDLAWSLADQYWKNSAELLLVALENGLSPNFHEPFQPAWNLYRSCTLLHIEAQRMEKYVYLGYPIQPSLKVIAKYIENGADLHCQDSFGATPLDDILSYKGFDNEAHKAVAIFEWIRLLQGLGVSLPEYFQTEHAIHNRGAVVHVKHYRPMIERKCSFEHGSETIAITVKDTWKEQSVSYEPPGRWFEERGGCERDAFGRYLYRNCEPLGKLSVTYSWSQRYSETVESIPNIQLEMG
ncbi:Ankyrin repeat-containing protein [Glarea lozoyensis ATCC 20868]|uniref:Ankyrin repeat-containing protein n=1 Tax=Glarea lozoyensis (strain ATCC 20868 / MF5171) TaxID=1116229 RepID=S3DDV2_GLAL2|nr:Ankyrin repeat-containing protein [Glarea lozoyensis ATCC 20868]EPE24808.1 Ankyrin repeat-containing protein [Glarea lozoyensis ATCC 20868]